MVPVIMNQDPTVFLLNAPLKATEGFVWESVAPKAGFWVAAGSRSLLMCPFDQVTPPPSVLIIHRQGCDSTPASAAELQADLRTIRRLSKDHRHQMLCVTCLPALLRCQLGFLSLPFPHPTQLSLFLSRCRSLSLPHVGLCV